MSLRFGAATSDRVTTPSLQITESSVYTWLVWFRATTLTTGRVLLGKNAFTGGGGMFFRISLTSATNLNAVHSRSIVNAQAESTGLGLVTNRWYCVAMTYDPADSQFIRLYVGGLRGVLAEVSYLASPDNGSGTQDSSTDLVIGNHAMASPTASFQGDIWRVGFYTRKLTLGDMQSWQYAPRLSVNCEGLWRLGRSGTSLQLDESRNGRHGTVTGATPSTDPPLDVSPFRYRIVRPPVAPYFYHRRAA